VLASFHAVSDPPVQTPSQSQKRPCCEHSKPSDLEFSIFGLPAANLVKRESFGVRRCCRRTTVAEALWLARYKARPNIAQSSMGCGHRGLFLSEYPTTQVVHLRCCRTAQQIALGQGARSRCQRRHCVWPKECVGQWRSCPRGVQPGTPAYLRCPEGDDHAAPALALAE